MKFLCFHYLAEHKPPISQSRYTPYKCTGPVYSDFPHLPPVMLICIVCRDILLNHVPARAHRPVVATRSPKMVTAPFLQMGKFFPEHPATSTFDHLRYITYGIFWRIFNKYMHMVRIYCHINDLNIKLSASLPYIPFHRQPRSIHSPVRQHPDHRLLTHRTQVSNQYLDIMNLLAQL